ncbi:MAG: mandelate racemase/muconate lactonizing enzyme family protein [Planctomycetes bacterium]|nr:mandelate racemase/muconate lactonizing enzyme family protein [Planctomycetota bacterium]
MSKATDVRVVGASLYFLPVRTRVPLKFGPETLTHVTCARACVKVADSSGRTAVGWGETPLSVQWVWPSSLAYESRHEALKGFCVMLAEAWAGFEEQGHPIEITHEFDRRLLGELLAKSNDQRGPGSEQMPWLAGLVCCSLFDLALHDAYGTLHKVPSFETYNAKYMNRDLAFFLTEADGSQVDFAGRYPEDFLARKRSERMPAWHLVGGLDLRDETELTGSEPDDGYPVVLTEWIKTDGLTCLKVKLRGTDSAWDYDRLVKVGRIAVDSGVDWLTADFNCTVTDPAYVNEILDRLCDEHPRIYGMILYVEQPFPYDLPNNRIDVHSLSARKPLFLDESAHDWRMIELGRELGWTGVALKTCKTLSGALLSACWAKAHGMTLMVQDLTNPMLAQIPHVLLAAYAGTIMGVETNGMQFYPEASAAERAVHPGIYIRRNGSVDLSSLRGAGLEYRLAEIKRQLPSPAVEIGM